LWPERGRRRQDLLLRATTSGVAVAIFILLAVQQPQGMHDLLSNRHFPWIPSDWNALAQLPAVLFLLATAALGWQAWRQPRPLHTAMLLALLCLWWMLPRIFLQPVLLPALSVAALLLMLGATLQESFHMAFGDELTGLPGRRAFRYGGEEFAVVFLDRPASACVDAVEALRQGIEQSRMQLRDRSTRTRDDTLGQQQRGRGGGGAVVQVTVSIGLADSRVDRRPAGVVKAADQALYAAKEEGRNRVCAHGGQRVLAVRGSQVQTASR
jgi:GGDEF domain-containing protein